MKRVLQRDKWEKSVPGRWNMYKCTEVISCLVPSKDHELDAGKWEGGVRSKPS